VVDVSRSWTGGYLGGVGVDILAGNASYTGAVFNP